jgi:hypothetical protein
MASKPRLKPSSATAQKHRPFAENMHDTNRLSRHVSRWCTAQSHNRIWSHDRIWTAAAGGCARRRIETSGRAGMQCSARHRNVECPVAPPSGIFQDDHGHIPELWLGPVYNRPSGILPNVHGQATRGLRCQP